MLTSQQSAQIGGSRVRVVASPVGSVLAGYAAGLRCCRLAVPDFASAFLLPVFLDGDFAPVLDAPDALPRLLPPAGFSRVFFAASTLACSAAVKSDTLVAAGGSAAGWNSFSFFFASMSSLTRSV